MIAELGIDSVGLIMSVMITSSLCELQKVSL